MKQRLFHSSRKQSTRLLHHASSVKVASKRRRTSSIEGLIAGSRTRTNSRKAARRASPSLSLSLSVIMGSPDSEHTRAKNREKSLSSNRNFPVTTVAFAQTAQQKRRPDRQSWCEQEHARTHSVQVQESIRIGVRETKGHGLIQSGTGKDSRSYSKHPRLHTSLELVEPSALRRSYDGCVLFEALQHERPRMWGLAPRHQVQLTRAHKLQCEPVR